MLERAAKICSFKCPHVKEIGLTPGGRGDHDVGPPRQSHGPWYSISLSTAVRQKRSRRTITLRVNIMEYYRLSPRPNSKMDPFFWKGDGVISYTWKLFCRRFENLCCLHLDCQLITQNCIQVTFFFPLVTEIKKCWPLGPWSILQ
jgi:hypothetical protein